MAKLAQNFAKYVIHAKIDASGIVEKPDVIGAVFGQTEGLLGGDLDLRELQKSGRIGRIDVVIRINKGRAYGEVTIPSSLDASETALIGASLETIEKIGPCDAKIEIARIEDVRTQKRRYTIERAKELLRKVMDEGVPDSQKLTESIKSAVRTFEVGTYQGLSCGPDIATSDEIIVVEGRADVINLLRCGIRNSVAVEGSKIPDAIVKLTKEKVVTALLDGDRGGDLILKRLIAVGDIDFVARAEEGKEVEELTKKEIYKSLRDRVPIDQVKETGANASYKNIVESATEEEIEEKPTGAVLDENRKTVLTQMMNDLIGSRAAYLVDRSGNILTKVPLNEIGAVLDEYKGVEYLLIDSKINQAITDLALQSRVKYLIGMDLKEQVKGSATLKILTVKDLKG